MEFSNLEDLIGRSLELMEDIGCSKSNIMSYKKGYFTLLSNYFKKVNKEVPTVEGLEGFVTFQHTRMQHNKISCNYFTILKRAAKILEDVLVTGTLQWKVYNNGSVFHVEEYFNSIMCGFTESLNVSSTTQMHHKTRIRRFLSFLESEGKTDFSALDQQDIIAYIKFIYPFHKGDMGHTMHTLRIFLRYLVDHGLISEKLIGISLQKPVPARKTVKPCFTKDEVTLILDQINRTTHIGKRDFAILWLASHTGMRASDIANLKLYDIDWKNDCICIVQKKTGGFHALPLTPETGNALADYILNSRPDTKDDHVFIRSETPFTSFKTSGVFLCILKKYMKKAEILYSNGDGRTFHGFRRSIATWMLEADMPLYTISQVLGHSSVNSAKAYLSMDEKKLSECAIGFGLIPIEGGIYL